MRLSRPFSWALLALLLLASVAAAEELAKLRDKLAREDDPANRAKITVRIGEKLLKKISQLYDAGAYTDGESLLAEYLQSVRAAHQDLQQSGRDARRKPKGFKHLEIHLRKSERKLQDLARRLPFDVREPLEAARTQMEEIRQELLTALMGIEQQSENDTTRRESQL